MSIYSNMLTPKLMYYRCVSYLHTRGKSMRFDHHAILTYNIDLQQASVSQMTSNDANDCAHKQRRSTEIEDDGNQCILPKDIA